MKTSYIQPGSYRIHFAFPWRKLPCWTPNWRRSTASKPQIALSILSWLFQCFWRVDIFQMCGVYYRPQRSWGKVMFLHASVILFTGGGWLVSQHALQVVSQHALQQVAGGMVSQHALQVSRPTPKGKVEGSGLGGRLQAHTWGVPALGRCLLQGGACSKGVCGDPPRDGYCCYASTGMHSCEKVISIQVKHSKLESYATNDLSDHGTNYFCGHSHCSFSARTAWPWGSSLSPFCCPQFGLSFLAASHDCELYSITCAIVSLHISSQIFTRFEDYVYLFRRVSIPWT